MRTVGVPATGAAARAALRQLRAARALIAEPGAWLHKQFAQDRDYRIVPWWSERACRFCALTALWAAGRREGVDVARSFLLLAIAPAQSVARWNDEDGRTHPEVLAAFDGAIARAEAAA